MDSKINDTILEVLKPYNPIEVALFGSYARGTETKDSDIDIAVEFPRGFTLFDMGAILNDFKEIHKLNIDLVDFRGMSDKFKRAITPDLKYIYRSVQQSA